MTEKTSKDLAREARAWVASEEGQEAIRQSLAEARRITNQLNACQQIKIENLRIPFI